MKDRVAALLRDGQVAAHAGKKAKARRKFRAALIFDPANVTALLWMAWLSDDPRASLAYIIRVLASDAHNPRAHAALRWARRRVTSPPPPKPLPPATSAAPASRHRWTRPVAAVALGLLLVVIIGGALAWFLPAGPPALAALAPTLTPIPTYTPTLTHTPTPPAVLPTAQPLPPPQTLSPASFPDNVRWIEVDVTQQVLNAYEGQTLVRTTLVSTGMRNTPTPIGLYRIQTKMRYDDMTGPGYYLRNVPYVMYFYRGYGLHGTYWHANFGHPMSHGCINLPTTHAEWIFNWAEVGTLVYIHG